VHTEGYYMIFCAKDWIVVLELPSSV